MGFSFIHTADWQIGRAFSGFPDDIAALLREARLEAIERIARCARERGIAHVLVAGDIYDQEVPRERTLREPLEIMARHNWLRWHLIPGNHDPARAGGLWHRVAMLGPPANVRLHLEERIAEIAGGVALLPAPLRTRTTSIDPTAWMDTAETAPGTLRIGLAHGAIGRYGSEGSAAVPIDPRRARHAGLDYLALGDDHGLKRIDDRTWYSGTPEPDSWRQNKPGHVLAVTLGQAGETPHVTPIATAHYTWLERTLELTGPGALDELARELAEAHTRPRRLLLRLRVRGN